MNDVWNKRKEKNYNGFKTTVIGHVPHDSEMHDQCFICIYTVMWSNLGKTFLKTLGK